MKMTKRQLVATILSGGMYPFPADTMYKNVEWAVDVANRVIEVTPEEPKDEGVEYLGLLVSEIHELRDEVAKLWGHRND